MDDDVIYADADNWRRHGKTPFATKRKKIKVTNVTKCVIPMETHGRYACSRTVE